MSFNNGKDCIDGMIWIGKSYNKIFCNREENCAIPFKPKKSPHCYVHEAEWRGCCRKIPEMNSWLIKIILDPESMGGFLDILSWNGLK